MAGVDLEEKEEEGLWRILTQRKVVAAGDAAEEDEDSDFVEYHLYMDSVARSSDPGRMQARPRPRRRMCGACA